MALDEWYLDVKHLFAKILFRPCTALSRLFVSEKLARVCNNVCEAA